MKPQALTGSPEIGTAIVRLMSDDVFVALAMTDPEQRAAALEAVLLAVADDDVRVVWVGNPLRSALTMVRFILQILGPEIDLRIERGPAELARLFAHREASENRVLVIVQQPETIDPETLEELGAMGGHLADQAVQLQFLFVGSPAMRLPERSSVEPSPLMSSPKPFEAGDWTVGAARKPRRVVALMLLLLIAILGAAVSLAAPVLSQVTASAPLPAVNLGATGLHDFLSR